VSEGLAQGSYVAAREGFEPATLRTEGTEHAAIKGKLRLSAALSKLQI